MKKIKDLKEAVDSLRRVCPDEMEYIEKHVTALRERMMEDLEKFADTDTNRMQVAKISALTKLLRFLG